MWIISQLIIYIDQMKAAVVSLVENLFKKNILQDLLSSVNAVISNNERIELITGQMTYNPAYT